MSFDESRVAIVLSPDFGNRLAELSGRMNVWIWDTPENRPYIEACWGHRLNAAEGEGVVTTFSGKPGTTPNQTLLSLLPTIDLHHGEYAQEEPYSVLEVHGAEASPDVAAVLYEWGFEVSAVMPEGFVAMRSSL